MFDVIIIGGGSAGYIAAINCAKNGFKVACIEKQKLLGGSCLNVGCIPSKTLLDISHKFASVNDCQDEGIIVGNISINIAQMMATKTKRLTTLAGGIEILFKKHKIEHIFGEAKFIDNNTVMVEKNELKAKNFIIATGSVPMIFDNFKVDEKIVCTSTGALSLVSVPKKMFVVGAGFIGIELGCVWSRLGADVTVIEYGDRIMPSMDNEISIKAQKIFEKQGLKFMLNTKINNIYTKGKKGAVEIENETLLSDIILVSTGRKPCTDGINIDIKKDSKGFIIVDKNYKTSINNIYAIGDVIGGQMLAHKAEHEAIAISEILSGRAGHINYDLIPGIVYTNPEIASIGKTEEELKKAGIEYKIGKSNMSTNSRSQAVGRTDGMVKILADSKTDRVLGAHIIGVEAGNMIHEIAVLMEFSGSGQDLAMICHGHPTFNEAVKDAAINLK
jgi:dihydrolipoamide dehydrogenase